eukprot:1545355-Rhodomonas_salina.7
MSRLQQSDENLGPQTDDEIRFVQLQQQLTRVNMCHEASVMWNAVSQAGGAGQSPVRFLHTQSSCKVSPLQHLSVSCSNCF